MLINVNLQKYNKTSTRNHETELLVGKIPRLMLQVQVVTIFWSFSPASLVRWLTGHVNIFILEQEHKKFDTSKSLFSTYFPSKRPNIYIQNDRENSDTNLLKICPKSNIFKREAVLCWVKDVHKPDKWKII